MNFVTEPWTKAQEIVRRNPRRSAAVALFLAFDIGSAALTIRDPESPLRQGITYARNNPVKAGAVGAGLIALDVLVIRRLLRRRRPPAP